MHKGMIVEESLQDNRILNKFQIINCKISNNEKPEDRRHIYTVTINEKDINELSKNIKPKRYMHFWKDKKVTVIFQNKIFTFNHDNKSSRTPAITYGISIGIPKEQLDFPITE